jgi:phage repressor protein C with HTH and peptisase S24 domain
MVVTLRDGTALPADATFLVDVADDSLEPRFRRGATLYVDTRQPPEIGDAVLLVVDGIPTVALLLSRSAHHLRIQTGGRIADLALDTVSAVCRIVPAADLLL